MKAVAIDLGLKGAMAFYDSTNPPGTFWEPMPVAEKKVDWPSLHKKVAWFDPQVMIIERLMAFKRPKARPGEFRGTPVDTAMGMGEQMGNVNMLATIMGIRLVWVTPTQWQKGTLLPGLKNTTKARSIYMAGQLYPQIDLTHNGRFKSPHDGAADALCILDWGLRHIGGTT